MLEPAWLQRLVLAVMLWALGNFTVVDVSLCQLESSLTRSLAPRLLSWFEVLRFHVCIAAAVCLLSVSRQ